MHLEAVRAAALSPAAARKWGGLLGEYLLVLLPWVAGAAALWAAQRVEVLLPEAPAVAAALWAAQRVEVLFLLLRSCTPAKQPSLQPWLARENLFLSLPYAILECKRLWHFSFPALTFDACCIGPLLPWRVVQSIALFLHRLPLLVSFDVHRCESYP